MVLSRAKGKHYDSAIIEPSIALGEEIGVARAARVLGIPSDIIQKWIRRKRDGRYMTPSDTPEQKEMMELKRELQKLKRENEDLKKANIILKEIASVFSKDHPSSDLEWSSKSTKNGKKK